MNSVKALLAVAQVAQREGISTEDAISAINHAISEAYGNAVAFNDYETLARWKRVPSKNGIPTAVEFVSHLAKELGGK